MKGYLLVSAASAAFLVAVAGCGSPARHHGDDMVDVDAPTGEPCTMEGAHRCEGASYQTCTGGVWQNAIDCPVACLDGIGCVQCTPTLNFCKDGNVWTCDDSGNPGMQKEVCTGVQTCIGGGCVDACMDAAANKSYIGCEYWAADLDNAMEVWGAIGQPLGTGVTLTSGVCTTAPPAGYGATVQTLNVCFGVQGGGPNAKTYAFGLCDPPATAGGAPTCPAGLTCGAKSVCVSDAQHSPFAVVVSNPQSHDATVTMTGPDGTNIVRTIAAGQVSSILPQTGPPAIADQSIDGSVKQKRAYRITSDLPVVAYQFNPLDNVNVFSNDASLLIPRQTFDQDYYVMAYQTLDRRAGQTYGTNPYYGYLTIVAWQDNTQVTVTPTVATTASAIQATLVAGVPTTFTLNAFEVLQLESSGAGDLTGTHITSPTMSTFAVFGGHEATAFGEATAPDTKNTSGPCCADHLEEMMFPSSTWGKTFALARSQSRGTGENDVVRVLAQAANTNVTFNPAPVSGTCGVLGAGQFCEVKIAVDTEVTADQPVLVGQYLESAIWSTPPGTPQSQQSTVGTGDPSMAIAAPTEQFRKDYAFLVPAQYEANYVSISAPATGGIQLDGAPVTLTPFAGAMHRAARVQLTAGQHKITCADGCGIMVYGWSSGGVSYMFAGGLDLKPIVVF